MKIFNLLINWIQKRIEKRKRREEKLQEVLVDYNQLIEEYRLIQEKKSTLSKSQRDFVILRIKHLIHKGHIVVQK